MVENLRFTFINLQKVEIYLLLNYIKHMEKNNVYDC